MLPRLRIAALIVAAALCAAGARSAAADPAERPDTAGPVERPASAESADSMIQTERQIGDLTPDALPTVFSPYHYVRAVLFPARAIELFGQGTGFAVGDGLSVLELEGGAGLRVLENLRFTASYRLIDADLRSDGLAPGIGGQSGNAGAFVGIAVDF